MLETMAMVSNGSMWVALAAPLFLYFLTYIGLRMTKVLAASAGGWHAGGLKSGRTVLVSALAMLTVFEPLLCAEARLRRAAAAGKAAEPQVSDVVVEFVPLS